MIQEFLHIQEIVFWLSSTIVVYLFEIFPRICPIIAVIEFAINWPKWMQRIEAMPIWSWFRYKKL
jgi:hypothetical protein